MPESKPTKNLSPLAQTVLDLDTHFSDLARLGAKIDEMDLKSNFDFEQVERLIHHFAETGNLVSAHIIRMSEELTKAREAAESAALKVAKRAEQLQARKLEIQEKMNQFQSLSEKVTQLNLSLRDLAHLNGTTESLSPEDRSQIAQRLNAVELQLPALIDEASVLKTEAQSAKIKILEQNADSMRQSLLAVQQKLSSLHQAQLI